MLSFFPRGVLGEILNLIESVSEGFPSYFWMIMVHVSAIGRCTHNGIFTCISLLLSSRSNFRLKVTSFFFL